MGLHKTRAIVLRYINLSETDRLATFLTETYGKVKCVAKAARRMKSRYGAALQPMSYLQVIYFGKETQELFRLNQADILHSFQSVRDDFQKMYTGVYFIELIDSLLKEAHPDPKIFHLLLDALRRLEEEEDPEPLCRLFELRLLSLSGYRPRLDHCMVCKKEPASDEVGFNFQRGGIVCPNCWAQGGPDSRMNRGTLNYLKKFLTLDIKHSGRLKFPKGVGEEMETIIHRLVRAHLGRELKSYRFVKQMAALE